MVTKFDVKVVGSGTGLSINIPKPIREGFEIRKGSELTIYAYDDELVIRVKKNEPTLVLKKTDEPKDDPDITVEDYVPEKNEWIQSSPADTTSPSAASSNPP